MTCVASYTENHGALNYTKHILQAPPRMENLQKHGSSGLKLNPKWWSFRFDVLSSRVLARVVLLQMFVELSA